MIEDKGSKYHRDDTLAGSMEVNYESENMAVPIAGFVGAKNELGGTQAIHKRACNRQKEAEKRGRVITVTITPRESENAYDDAHGDARRAGFAHERKGKTRYASDWCGA